MLLNRRTPTLSSCASNENKDILNADSRKYLNDDFCASKTFYLEHHFLKHSNKGNLNSLPGSSYQQ